MIKTVRMIGSSYEMICNQIARLEDQMIKSKIIVMGPAVLSDLRDINDIENMFINEQNDFYGLRIIVSDVLEINQFVIF